MSFPYQVYAAAWIEVHRHWLQLLDNVRANDDLSTVIANDMEQGAAKKETWRNLTLYLAGTLSCCSESSTATSSLRKHLPPRLRPDRSLKETVDRFLDQLVLWLVSKSVLQRDTAVMAICYELDPGFYPDLLFKLDGSVCHRPIFARMI